MTTPYLALSQIKNATYVAQSGAVYVADKYGVIANVATLQDMADLVSAGCAQLTPPPTDLLGKLLGANFNSTADQQISLTFTGKYRVKRIVVCNTSVNGMSTAAGGLYSAASKGGSAIVAAGQVYTGLTNALTALELTMALPTLVLAAGTPLFLSLTTPQGAAALADVYAYGDVYV